MQGSVNSKCARAVGRETLRMKPAMLDAMENNYGLKAFFPRPKKKANTVYILFVYEAGAVH
jgi:hypothetical protein